MHHFEPQRCGQSGKIMYRTQEQCLQAARKSYQERGVRLWAYRCDDCGNWHLTSRAPIPPSLRFKTPAHGSTWGGKSRSRKRGFKPRKR